MLLLKFISLVSIKFNILCCKLILNIFSHLDSLLSKSSIIYPFFSCVKLSKTFNSICSVEIFDLFGLKNFDKGNLK